MKKYGCLLCLLSILSTLSAQYSERKLSKKQQEYTDSIKKITYNHTFPILGQKAYKAGFDIPLPAGIMTNYFWAKQGLLIDNLQLGLKTNNHDIPLTPIDFIVFGRNTAEASTFNVRPDIWVFPFLDVYGIFGYGKAITTVNLTSPITLTSIVEQDVSTAGFGVTGAFSLGIVFFVLDGNWTWNKPEKLEKPVPVQTFSIRVGHNFQFKHKPQSNIAIWAGAMRARMGSGTVGEINLSDALPQSTWDKRDQIVNEYNTWYNALDPTKPADRIKKEVADQVLTPIIQRIEALDGSAVIRYALDKSPTEEWNMIIGGQYQLNKRWAFRTEGGIVGDRKSILLSIQYRFMIF